MNGQGIIKTQDFWVDASSKLSWYSHQLEVVNSGNTKDGERGRTTVRLAKRKEGDREIS